MLNLFNKFHFAFRTTIVSPGSNILIKKFTRLRDTHRDVKVEKYCQIASSFSRNVLYSTHFYAKRLDIYTTLKRFQ